MVTIGLNMMIGNAQNVMLGTIGLTLKILQADVLVYALILTIDVIIATLKVSVLTADVNGCQIKKAFVLTKSRIVK